MPANLYALLVRHLRGPACRDELSSAALLTRFVQSRDEAAFSALVRRHGALVLGLCRRWLGRHHDAEDVFQATFLVLARRAASIRKKEALASWLHGVALRLARKALAAAASHSRPIRATHFVEPLEPLDQLCARELRQGLDDELHRLPECYRAPLVLCYLQGRTQEEAARELGWSKGTMRRRLGRGRDLLRARLAGRGLAPAPLLGSPLLGGSPLLPIPAALADRAVQTALTPGALSRPVADLAAAAAGARGCGRLRAALALLLAGGVVAVVVGMAENQASGPAEALPARTAPPHKARAVPREVKPLPYTWALAFTPDGKTLVTCGAEGWIRLWDPETGRLRRRFGRKDIVQIDGLTLADDGRTLATLTYWSRPRGISHTAEVWDVAAGKITQSFDAGCWLREVALAPDGKTLACFGMPDLQEPTIWLKDLTGKRPPRTIRTADLNALTGAARNFLRFSPDGRLLALGGRTDGSRIAGYSVPSVSGFPVHVWDVASGRSVCALTGAEGQSSCLAFTPDSKYLATGSYDGTVRQWDLVTGTCRSAWRVPDGGVLCLAVSPDGKTVVAGSRGNNPQVVAWDRASGKEVFRRPLPAYQLAFSPDGQRLAVLEVQNRRWVLDAHTARPVFVAPDPIGKREKK